MTLSPMLCLSMSVERWIGMELPLAGLILILYMKHNHCISLWIALVTMQLLCTKVSEPFLLKGRVSVCVWHDVQNWSMICEREQANLVVQLVRFSHPWNGHGIVCDFTASWASGSNTQHANLPSVEPMKHKSIERSGTNLRVSMRMKRWN